jgi:hypothetical protein
MPLVHMDVLIANDVGELLWAMLARVKISRLPKRKGIYVTCYLSVVKSTVLGRTGQLMDPVQREKLPYQAQSN